MAHRNELLIYTNSDMTDDSGDMNNSESEKEIISVNKKQIQHQHISPLKNNKKTKQMVAPSKRPNPYANNTKTNKKRKIAKPKQQASELRRSRRLQQNNKSNIKIKSKAKVVEEKSESEIEEQCEDESEPELESDGESIEESEEESDGESMLEAGADRSAAGRPGE